MLQILATILAIALALEDKENKGKRDIPDDYHNDHGPGGGHGGRAVSYSEVVQRVLPTRNFNTHLPNFNQFHHSPQHFPIGRPALPVKYPLPYPVLVKRIPVLVDRPVVPLAAAHPTIPNFIITKVPLLYHNSYGDQPQPEYNHFTPSTGRNYGDEHY
ncbi:uncharacterized protein [Rhodnius prolixus]|uniref:uncharacterized protein n=1 Tax=Rhodnius prolixus TaxID=13249 RepID=UPI003D18CF2C